MYGFFSDVGEASTSLRQKAKLVSKCLANCQTAVAKDQIQGDPCPTVGVHYQIELDVSQAVVDRDEIVLDRVQAA